jgi:exodeoxyribonuclease V
MDSQTATDASTTRLSPGQQEAVAAIAAWYANPHAPQVQRMYGVAGTGKTTIARVLPGALGLMPGSVLYAALAGKAAMVLRSKGCEPASTLHKLAYKPMPTIEALRAGDLADALRERQQAGEAGLAREIMEAELSARKTEWARNPDSEIRDAALLICDEVSMVGPQLGRDLEAYGTRILVIGDPEQLPPVDGAGYFTSAPADVELTEIHRQALDSPVLELATRIRNGDGPAPTDYARAPFNPGSAKQMAAIADHYDQVLVGRRATRWAVVHGMRAAAGRQRGVPAPGDRIMCIANNPRMGIFNGQQFEVVDAYHDVARNLWRLEVAHDDGGMQTLDGWAAGFEDEAGEMWAARNGRGSVAALTFAQAITVHKSQGSEWRRVLVVDESSAFAYHESKANGPAAGMRLQRRWRYTAVTRASERVTLTRVAR